MEELSPNAILAKVEHYQEGVRDLVKSLKLQLQMLMSFCTLLEMTKQNEEGED
jgi:hypothetical protein